MLPKIKSTFKGVVYGIGVVSIICVVITGLINMSHSLLTGIFGKDVGKTMQDIINATMGWFFEWWPEIAFFGGSLLLVGLIWVYVSDYIEARKKKSAGKLPQR